MRLVVDVILASIISLVGVKCTKHVKKKKRQYALKRKIKVEEQVKTTQPDTHLYIISHHLLISSLSLSFDIVAIIIVSST